MRPPGKPACALGGNFCARHPLRCAPRKRHLRAFDFCACPAIFVPVRNSFEQVHFESAPPPRVSVDSAKVTGRSPEGCSRGDN